MSHPPAHIIEEPNTSSFQDGYGYLPIKLNQKIGNGRFEVIRKLGWARNSTVWLTRTLSTSYTEKYVAVKVLTMHASVGHYTDKLHETDMLERIGNYKSSKHPGLKHCLHFYERFMEGEQVPHICIVTEVLGGHLVNLQRAFTGSSRVLPLPIVKRITKQKLLALDFLHRICNIVHTDIKPDNVLVYLPNINLAIEEALRTEPSREYPQSYEQLQTPEPVITVASQPLKFDGKNLDPRIVEIRLADFGEAQIIGDRTLNVVQPVQLRAPEVMLFYPWGAAIDIWSVGCLTFEYLTGTTLFERPESDRPGDNHDHLKQMMNVAGKKFAQEFLFQCKPPAGYRDAINQHQPKPSQLGPGLVNFAMLKQEDVSSAATFIRKCLELDPRARSTAEILLGDSWLSGV